MPSAENVIKSLFGSGCCGLRNALVPGLRVRTSPPATGPREPKQGKKQQPVRHVSIASGPSGLSITLTLAGDRSKNPGSITVTNGKPYGDEDGRYYGRISPDGIVSPARSWTDEIQEAVITYNATGNATGGEEADDLPF